MTPEEEARDARRLKRLEMIQAIITRTAQNSFAIKGWAITVCAAILALGAKDGALPFAPLAIVPTLIFWGLDAYYLSLERRYRALYERAAADFDPAMTLKLGDAQQSGAALTVPYAMFAWVVMPVYVALLGLAAAIIYNAHR
jgi:hypothetical protein